jgi:hypothetical protein
MRYAIKFQRIVNSTNEGSFGVRESDSSCARIKGVEASEANAERREERE